MDTLRLPGAREWVRFAPSGLERPSWAWSSLVSASPAHRPLLPWRHAGLLATFSTGFHVIQTRAEEPATQAEGLFTDDTREVADVRGIVKHPQPECLTRLAFS